MRTPIVYLATLLALFLTFSSCAANKNKQISDVTLKSINVKVNHFKEIKVSGSLNVEYTQVKSSEPKVQISGPEKMIEKVEVYEKNKVLHIELKNEMDFFSEDTDKLKVTVSSSDLQAASLLGSGDISIKGAIDTEVMEIFLMGSGDINTENIICKGEFKALLKGSGDINLGGKTNANEIELELLGSGDLVARHLSADNGNISLLGSGDLNIKGIQSTSINASLKGSGDLQLEGTCSNAILNLVSSGNLKAQNLRAQDVIANLVGSGDLSCHAIKTLKYSVNGSGIIYYNGEPTITSKKDKSKHLKKL